MQRRWLCGSFFAVAFCIAAIGFLVTAAAIIVTFYRLAFNSDAQITPPSYYPMLVWLLAAVGIYLGSLWDTYRAELRHAAALSRQRLEHQAQALTPCE